MSTLAPKMTDQISYERPVGAAPSVFEAVVGTVAELAGDLSASGSKKTQAQVDNEVLSEYTRQMDDLLTNSDLERPDAMRKANRLTRDFKRSYGGLAPEFDAIAEDTFGVSEGLYDTGRAVDEGFQKFLETPEGQAAALSYSSQPEYRAGQQNPDDMNSYMFAEYQRHIAWQAEIAREAGRETGDKIKWRRLGDEWREKNSKAAAGMITELSNNPDWLKNPEEGMNFLDSAIRSAKDAAMRDATAMGVGITFANEHVNEIIQPLLDTKNMIESQLETPGKMLNAFEKANELGVQRELIEVLGPLGSDPILREIFYTQFVEAQLIGDEATSEFFKSIREDIADGNYQGYNLKAPIMPGTTEAITGADVTVPEKVSDWRRKAKDDPNFLSSKVTRAIDTLGGVDITTTEGKEAMSAALTNVTLAAKAHDGPLGVVTMRALFSPKNMQRINGLGEEAQSTVAAILIDQARKNRALVADSNTLLKNARVRLVNGEYVAERQLRAGIGEWTAITDPSDKLGGAVASMNQILKASQGIPGLGKKIQNATNFLARGVEPDQAQVDADITWDDLEDVQFVSYQAPNALVPLIDRTEGGGEYDTLFGFSNRSGGQFSGVKVDEMTIDQVLNFSSPDGAYGQWVKGEVGRVATPMGRYQFVGTTLREVAGEMGLSGDVVFNRKTQDAMFDHLARKVIRGKSGAAARSALRDTWEGFKNVGDRELDQAIAAFKGQPAPQYDSLDRAQGGAMPGGMGAPVVSTPSNGFMAMDFGGRRGDVAPEAIRENPKVDNPTAANLDTSSVTRSSRVSAAEAKRQIITALKEQGYSEEEIAGIVKEGES